MVWVSQEEYAVLQNENTFLNEHLETRKGFMNAWYEMNLYQLLNHEADPEGAELELRAVVAQHDITFRRSFTR